MEIAKILAEKAKALPHKPDIIFKDGKGVESNGQFRDVSQFYAQIKYTF